MKTMNHATTKHYLLKCSNDTVSQSDKNDKFQSVHRGGVRISITGARSGPIKRQTETTPNQCTHDSRTDGKTHTHIETLGGLLKVQGDIVLLKKMYFNPCSGQKEETSAVSVSGLVTGGSSETL